MHGSLVTRSTGASLQPALVALGCMLIAANLRPAITAVGPLLGDIRAATGISATAAGLLTTLPLLAFAGISSLAPVIARRIGLERALLAVLLVLAAGLLVRSAGPASTVFAGTAVLGAAIAVGNVLLPGLVKQDFPRRAGLLTGLYSTTLVGMAGVGSGLSIVLADRLGLGWRGSLASWGLLAVAVAALWAPHARRSSRPPAPAQLTRLRLRRSLLAWQVTVFMGLQSLLFYGLITWLPTLLEDGGMSASAAGWMVALMQVVSLVTTIGVPMVVDRRADQRLLVVVSSTTCLLAVMGLWTLGAEAAVVWIVPLGLGIGGVFSLALLFFVLRASDPRHTNALSGMAQSFGYGIAAIGPIGLGFLHDATGSWDVPVLTLAATTVGLLVIGLSAARDARVG